MTALLQQEVKGLSTSLNSNDYSNAIDAAERETWTLPVSTDFKIKWVKQRALRHMFAFLRTESASKFQYKNIRLQHRFANYNTLVKDMDKAFDKALEEDAFEFADVSAFEIAGHKIDAGFQVEPQTGRDLTYSDDNRVIITPNENS